MPLPGSGVERLWSRDLPFTGIHQIAKHIIYLREGIESSSLVVDAILARLSDPAAVLGPPKSVMKPGSTDAIPEIRSQLAERLRYRRSLFQSTALRLGSLQNRMDNVLALSFNIVTQHDSKVMLRHSNSMRIIAAITMIFLPVTTVATIIGSQLFQADSSASPLFSVLWYTAVPLTLLVFLLAYVWERRVHSLRRRDSVAQ